MILGAGLPRLVPQKHSTTENIINDNLKIKTKTLGVDRFSKQTKNKQKYNLKFAFSTKFKINVITSLRFLKLFQKVLKLYQETGKISSLGYNLLESMFKVNFKQLKKTMPSSQFKIVIEHALSWKDDQPKVNPMQYKKLFSENKYLEKVFSKISAYKLIYNENFVLIFSSARLKYFYNAYFVDFRGRRYPAYIANYMSIVTRNFTSFYSSSKLDIKNLSVELRDGIIA